MYTTILYSVENGIGRITLNRPDVFNSFNEQLSADFIDALKKATKDEAVRTVIITGEGKALLVTNVPSPCIFVTNPDVSRASIARRIVPIDT